MSSADLQSPPAWPHEPPIGPPGGQGADGAYVGGLGALDEPPAAPAATVPRRKRRPRWGCGDVGWAILIELSLEFLIGVPLIRAFPSTSAAVVVIGASVVWVSLGGWSLFCSWVKGLGTVKLDFRWAFRWFDVFIGFGLFVLMELIGIVLYIFRQLVDAKSATNTQVLKDQVKGGASWGFVIVALLVAVGAPIVEELFFRGLTYTAFTKRFGRVVGVIASASIFGLMHYQPGPLVPTLFLILNITLFGVVLALSRMYFDRTGPGVCAHMLFNLLPTLIILATATT
jgi:membrane protease YdiL (CAAX protease family)